MSQSIQSGSWIPRRRVWTTGVCLATLVASLLGAGCAAADDTQAGAADAGAADAGEADAGEEMLPYKPCGVERRGTDGTLSAFTYRAYDDRGNHILSERDNGFDGTVDDRYIWQYASHGGLTHATWQLSSDRMLELDLRYGADGYRTSATWSGDYGQGSVAYEYQDDAQSVIARWDRDDDGVAEETTTYTYSPDGVLQEYAITCSTSVDPELIGTIERSDDGRLLRVEAHRNGELLRFTDYSYNDDGSLSRVEGTSSDMLTYWESYEYDLQGNLASQTTARAILSAGEPTSWSVTTSVYDTEGRILSSEWSVDQGPASKNIYLYECPGFEDSPGRWVQEPPAPAPSATGPRGKADQSVVTTYARSIGQCRNSAVEPGVIRRHSYQSHSSGMLSVRL